jgi:hypothetical protein
MESNENIVYRDIEWKMNQIVEHKQQVQLALQTGSGLETILYHLKEIRYHEIYPTIFGSWVVETSINGHEFEVFHEDFIHFRYVLFKRISKVPSKPITCFMNT